MGNLKPKTGVSQPSRPRSVKSNKQQPVATVSEVDGIDEKYAMDDLQEDIEHGVAHPVSAMAELEDRVNDLDNAWESESLLGDMLEGLSDESVTNGKHPLLSLIPNNDVFFALRGYASHLAWIELYETVELTVLSCLLL